VILVMEKNRKVLPNKYYWVAVLFLLALSFTSALTFEYGWILLVFPLLLYLLGRGKQEQSEGLSIA